MNDKSHSPYIILLNAESNPPRLWRALHGPVYRVVRRPADPTLLAIAALARRAQAQAAQAEAQAQSQGDPSCQQAH
jgi:hypothetical protein